MREYTYNIILSFNMCAYNKKAHIENDRERERKSKENAKLKSLKSCCVYLRVWEEREWT